MRLVVPALFSLLLALPAAAAERVVDVPSRPGQAVRILLDAPSGRPAGSVVLLAGGHGNLNIAPDGRMAWGDGNQLVRTRALFARAGYAVAVADIAPDLRAPNGGGVNGYRWGEPHAQDIGAIIAHMRTIAAPVVLVGTSRAALSAANAAARLQGPRRPDGVVITAGMLMDEGQNQPSIQRNVPGIGRAGMPFLLVHHTGDACAYTPPSGPERFRALLTAASRVEVRMLTGGGAPRGDVCEANHYHGFVGLDDQVVREVTGWIARLPR